MCVFLVDRSALALPKSKSGSESRLGHVMQVATFSSQRINTIIRRTMVVNQRHGWTRRRSQLFYLIIFCLTGIWLAFITRYHGDDPGQVDDPNWSNPNTATSISRAPPRQLEETITTITARSKTPLAHQFVEKAFYLSGWADFVELCPHNQTILPHRAYKDFLVQCVAAIRTLGNTAGTPYNTKWPWWFRTMMRDASIQKNGLAGRYHMLQFNDPRLQMCVFDKGGTKQFRKIHCQHLHKGVSQRDFWQCFTKQPFYDYEVRNMTGKHGSMVERMRYNPDDEYEPTPRSEKAIFLRDPLDRFLSAFLDKCVRRFDKVDHCEPTSVFFNEETSPVSGLLWDTKKFFEMYVDTLPLKWNMHFFPEALQCGGLYRDIHNYNFIGNMGSELYRDLQRFVDRYPPLEPSVEHVFRLKKSGRENVTNTNGTETKAASKVLDFYTPRSLKRVLSYYAIDYMLLPIDIPEWAERMLSGN